MKQALVIFFLFSLNAGAIAQGNPAKTIDAKSFYLFQDFEPARVLFKSGSEKLVDFNYNVVTEEMIYAQKGGFLALEMPGIDTIFFSENKFIPFGEKFLEVIRIPPGVLFIRHQRTPISKGKPAGYGGYTQGAATSSLTSIYADRIYYNLKVPDDFDLKDKTVFFIRKGKQFHEVNSARQMIKAFPESKNIIKDYLKENKTNFDKPEEVLKILQLLQ